MPDLDADNCCMDEDDYGRFSDQVIVFDEDYGRSLIASFDGRKHKWDADNGDILRGVTHWMPLPEEPVVAPAADTEPPKETEVEAELASAKAYGEKMTTESRALAAEVKTLMAAGDEKNALIRSLREQLMTADRAVTAIEFERNEARRDLANAQAELATLKA